MTTLLEKLEERLYFTGKQRPHNPWDEPPMLEMASDTREVEGPQAYEKRQQKLYEMSVIFRTRFWISDAQARNSNALHEAKQASKKALARYVYRDLLTKVFEIEQHIANRDARAATAACYALRKMITDAGDET